MQRKLFSLLVAGLVFFMAVVGWNQSTRAALCSKCRDLMFVDSGGKCIDCGAPTSSGALQLCPKCSARRHQCEHCLAATTAKDEAAAQSQPADAAAETPHGVEPNRGDSHDKSSMGWVPLPAGGDSAKVDDALPTPPTGPTIAPSPPVTAKPDNLAPLENLPESKPPAELLPGSAAPMRLKPINPAKPGTYSADKWRYQLQIITPGTRTEGRWGWLIYDGQKLPRGGVNDFYNTPWGPIYWVDVPTTAWGLHGWMPIPLAQNRRQGRALTIPASISHVAPPTPSGAAANARAGMLEINKSHNGQLARLRVGHVLVIRLPGNPATGYQWQVAKANSPAVRLTVRPQYSPPAVTATGAAALGTYTFIFQAVQPGTGWIRLYYLRPNDSSRPRDTFTVGINVSPATAAATARREVPVASRGE